MEDKHIKPSLSLRAFLLLSSLLIFAMGLNSAINWKGVEIFNAMCLLIPFSTAWVWFYRFKRMTIYYLLDFHGYWWLLMTFLSSLSGTALYYYLSLFMVFLNLYVVLKRKENYMKDHERNFKPA